MFPSASDRPLLFWLLPAAGVLVVVFLVVIVVRLFGGERLPPPDELQAQALDQTESEELRVEAALKLTRHGAAAQPQMRQLLTVSKDSDVRAAAVQGLMDVSDWSDVPLMIEALDDPSPFVRTRASRAVWRQMGMTFEYNPHASPAERGKSIEKIKRQFQWQTDYRGMHHESPTLNQRVR